MGSLCKLDHVVSWVLELLDWGCQALLEISWNGISYWSLVHLKAILKEKESVKLVE